MPANNNNNNNKSQGSATSSRITWPFLMVVAMLCSSASAFAQASNEPSSTLLFSSRQAGVHAHPGNRLLSEVNQYELHDFSSILKSARRRLSSSDDGHVVLPFKILGRSLEVVLERDESVFRPGYKHVYLNADGKEVRSEGPLKCIFRASLTNHTAVNHGAFSLCDEDRISGTIFSDERFDFTIEPLTAKDKSGRHLLADDSEDGTVVHAVYTHDDLKVNPARMTRVMRRPDDDENGAGSSLRGSATANVVTTPFKDSKTKYVGLLVANDQAFYKKHGGNTHSKAAQLLATSSAYYRMLPSSAPYKVELDLAQMVTFEDKNPYSTPMSGSGLDDSKMLNVFGSWLAGSGYQPDAALLLSGVRFTSGAAGWGYVGTVCDRSNRYQVGETDGTMNDASISVISAHEIGHVLGSEHDDIKVKTWGRDCNNNPGIMGRRLQSNARFSECTIEWWRIMFTTRYNTNSNPACLESADYKSGSSPTAPPVASPTEEPTTKPPVANPTKQPTPKPTKKPPTKKPTKRPTKFPTKRPTKKRNRRGLEEADDADADDDFEDEEIDATDDQ